jgi:hypothetical protein
MKTVVGQVVLALVFLGLGLAAWTAGRWERRVADTREELALLQFSALEADYGDLEESMGYVRNMPWLTEGLLTDIKEDRAAAQYWQARYDALEPQRDTNGAIAEQKTELLALGADAAYRTAQREGSGDRQELLRRLDAALKSYTELLKKQGDADAAYNYEYIVRLRDTISKSRPASATRRPDPAATVPKSPGFVMAGDLPDGRTVHGDPGAPPPSTDMTQFKMHIPIRPDERQGGSDAGQGKQKIRKG